jgi:hypothetical protein
MTVQLLFELIAGDPALQFRYPADAPVPLNATE